MKTSDKPRISYWPYIRPHLPWLVAGPLVIVLDGILEILQPRFMAKIVDDGINATGISGEEQMRVILSTGGAMILLALLAIVCGIGGVFFSANGTFRFGASLRGAMYHKVQSYSFANIDKFSTASLVTRLTNDITNIQNTLMSGLRMVTRTSVMLVGAVISAVTINPDLALVTACAVPVLAVVIVLVQVKGFPYFKRMQEKIDALNQRVQESVTNIRVIKSFVREDHERKRFNRSAEDLFSVSVKASGIIIVLMPVMTLIMNITTVTVLWLGAGQVSTGDMLIGDLMSYSTYIMHILMSLMMMSMTLMMLSRARASSQRVKEVLSENPDIADRENVQTHPISRGKVEFRDVSFKYHLASPEYELEHVSFTVEPGQIIAIVGATGSGKSTLVQLIPRLYDVTEGQILVDGTDVRDYRIRTLREGIGMVLQKNVLFSGTIRDNIKWGRPNATEEQVIQAAKDAQAHDFIQSFSQGYDTLLEQGGVNVSGGQKQRLCIARAIIKSPPILILDDSTSAVDSDTESRIQEAFHKNLKHTTVFLIAQRISSVRSADKILVLDNGQMAGFGSHEELLTSNPIYQEIIASQNKAAEEGVDA